jgi:hypothetical protein
MASRLHLIAATLLAAIALSTAQCPGPFNTDANCFVIAGFGGDSDGETVYYAPGNNEDFGGQFATFGTCDPGSYLLTSLSQPGGNQISCGCLAANGNTQAIDW